MGVKPDVQSDCLWPVANLDARLEVSSQSVNVIEMSKYDRALPAGVFRLGKCLGRRLRRSLRM